MPETLQNAPARAAAVPPGRSAPVVAAPQVPGSGDSGGGGVRGRRYAGVVGRDADRQYVPAPMRRDVRLLGDLLGEVLRESGGQGLLDDVERLRRAVIAARHTEQASQPGTLRAIGEMVAAWP